MRLTYSLEMALQISAVIGAILEQGTECIRVDPLEDWRIWRNGQIVCACGTDEAGLAWLKEKGYPLDTGWLPELPVYVASGESFVDFRREKEEQGQ